MYIRRDISTQDYLLCESYREEDCWKHRVLVNLGQDPGVFVEYPGGNSFYFKEELEDTLRKKAVQYSIEELERLFVPFLDPEIRRIYEMFDRGVKRKKWKSLTKEELFLRQKGLHPFDKRRLHYLRCGRVNIGNLDTRPWGFLNVLLDKSRDEIEAVIEEMEIELPPLETLPYIYTALNMQRHFLHMLTRFHPWTLDQEKMDRCFVQDICLLNQDPYFFRGVPDHDPSTLHPYLKKYVILYFDGPGLARANGYHHMGDDFLGSFSYYRRGAQSARRVSFNDKEACERLGITVEEFSKMSRQELNKAFRLKAKEAHPDAGGDKEEFVAVMEAYKKLLKRK